ncbi:methyltransferase [Weizmannia acidilactici]|jgi:SAM-dependent methyltransferase|uniref:Methyltransferase n=1 Tax=Weizmannia acidilactici TaxID=2607726 RepID=A0A5J4JGY4_9BACI|nr:class I SAM-dependent methyltransferase [Weizmannia acidilactici]GER66964.1 methyltransferase [Weizmannia acidilactici]GER69618.1 methyltransferase [Weizmannia acidilactici]GER72705.1 methyltransferase [Weizmannia acidilactici]
MSYEDFAYVYDVLMEDAPYADWLRWIKAQQQQYGITGRRILDLACGTGELSVHLAREGYDVTGVDLSENMLAVASEKALVESLYIVFLQQNMCMLEGLHDFDIVAVFCDSLNYLETESEVKETFRHVYGALRPGGMFLFDVHSIYKIDRLFQNHTFADNGDDVSYIWNSFPGAYPHSVEHELSFFVFDEKTGLYERFDELHKQRTFPVETYGKWLREAGFEVKSPTADFKAEAPGPESERIFFTCIKR